MTVVYTNDFNKGVGVAPDHFVLSGAGGGGAAVCDSNGRWHMITNGGAGDTLRGILPTAQWFSADGRATIYWTTGPAVAGNIVPQIQLRTSGDWSSEIDSPNTGYKCIFLNGSGVGIFKHVAGVTTQLGPFVAKTIAANTTYGFTFEVSGSGASAIQRVRMFTGTSDPGGAYDITQADTAITGAGQFQCAMLSQDVGVRECNWDNLSIDNLVSAATGPRPRLMRV